MIESAERRPYQHSLYRAKDFSGLYLERRQIIQTTRGNSVWNSLSPLSKTILNLSFQATDEPVDMDEYRNTQSKLGNLLEIPPIGVRRITAVETHRLAYSLYDSTNFREPKERPSTTPKQLSGTVVDPVEGIIIAKNGQTYNFTEIYTSYQTKVYNLLYRIYGDRERALSDTQEVFTRFLVRIGSVDTEDFAVGPYLYRSATNLATDQLRRDTLIHFKSLSDYREDSESRSDESILEYLAVPNSGDLGRSLISQSEITAFYQVYDQLPPRYQWAITLVDLDGLGLLEAAEVLETKAKTMKSLHYRAAHEFKRQILRNPYFREATVKKV